MESLVKFAAENKYFEFKKLVGRQRPLNLNYVLAGPKVIIPTKLMCRLTCSLCWALDSDLVCPMHRQLTPNHAQQIVSGIQWVYTLVIPGTVHWTRLEIHMLVN